MSDAGRRRAGQACWVLQPAGILVELVAASLATVRYSLLDNTISDLGATSCGTIAYPGTDVAVCSPAHALVNASFLVGGLLVVAGAVLLWPSVATTRTAAAALVLWVVTGLSAAVTAALPLDRYLELHTLASLPGIVLQPVALGLQALALARSGRRHWWVGVGLGVVCFFVAVFFVLRLDPAWGGLLERFAIWPCLVALVLLALARPSPPSRSSSLMTRPAHGA